MNKKITIASSLILLSVITIAPAIDRGARMIDTISIEGTTSDSGDSLGGSLWGETSTSAENEKWAILFGGSLAKLWPDKEENANAWNIGLGVKYYLLPSTSMALTGEYMERDFQGKPDIKTGKLNVKHRLLPADDDISPYLLAGVGIRTVEYIHFDNDYTELIYSLGMGIDFMMAENYAITFEGTWNMTAEMGDDTSSDNWLMGRIGLTYYWDWD
jgi:opacity protein-like surface antigen